MRRVVDTVCGGLGCAAALPAGYLGVLTLASLRPHRCGLDRTVSFSIVVPAHDEETGIGETLDSLAALDYPIELVDVVVIADNCTDATADVARRAGVHVIERDEPDRRGKGPALAWAFERLADTDAVVVIDADTVVEPDLLQRAAFHIVAGAEAIQIDYGVRNPDESWRTLLLDVGFTAQHRIRGAGRRALGVSCGLRGNGMVFSRSLLERVPYTADSVVEDIEFGIALGQHGVAVLACESTRVLGDMPTGAGGAESQRTRWEAGRTRMRQTHLRPLATSALHDRDRILADLAVDLAVPPIATIVTGLVSAAALSLFATRGSVARRSVGLGVVALGLHVGTAIARSAHPLRALTAIGRAPAYLVWKRTLRRSDSWNDQQTANASWTRTERRRSVA